MHEYWFCLYLLGFGGAIIKCGDGYVLERLATGEETELGSPGISVDENGIVAERDIITLVEGATEYDFGVLSPKEMCILSEILIKCKPSK